MHPGRPRDIDLEEWHDGIGFHPANTLRKQLGHEAARQLVADAGRVLHGLLPAGRDKSIAFTLLEDVLMRANRALALGDGPPEGLDDDTLQRLAAHGPLAQDPRVEAYKAEQRGPEPASDGWAAEIADGSSVEPAADETLVRTIAPEPRDGIRLQVAGSTAMVGGGYVDIAVLTDSPERAAEAIEEAQREGYPFVGFHRTFHNVEEVTKAVQAILDAAQHAGMTPGPITISLA